MRRIRKANRLVCIAALAIYLWIGVSTIWGQETRPTPTLDELISGIAAAERRLINVRIESEAFEEQRASSDVPWERTSVSFSSTAWYNGMPKSKARVDVHSEVLRWEEGLAPWAEESYSVGFDGQFGREVRHAAGIPGQIEPVKNATITAEAPLELRDQWCELATGVMFSLNFLDYQEGISASQMLTKMRDEGVDIKISRERYQDADCVKLSQMRGEFLLWFDLEHGYAFRGRQWLVPGASGDLVPYKTDIVKRLVEAAPGIWFPAEASLTSFVPNEIGPDVRLSYRCSQVVANDPKFDEAVFQVPIPSDYIVRDKVSGAVYQKSMSLDLLRRELDKSVDIVMNNTTEASLVASGGGGVGDGNDATASREVVTAAAEANREMMTTAASGGGGVGDGNDATASREVVTAAAETVVGEATVRKGRGILWLLVLLTTMVLAVVAASTVKRRKRAKNVVIIVCVLLGSMGAPCLGAVEVETSNEIVMNALGRPKKQEARVNCGLNAIYITLKYLGGTPSLPELIRDLDLTDNFAKNLSLYELKGCLESHGMKVRGLRGDTPRIIREYADPNNVLIMHEKHRRGNEIFGHYVVVNRRGGRLWLNDPPFSPQICTVKDITGRPTTGRFLVICPVKSSIDVDETIINLGKILSTQRTVTGKVRFRNTGDGVLKIHDIRGSCNCFAGYEGTTEIEPGGKGEITIKFKKEALPGGHNVRRALLRTNDPQHESVVVHFRFFIQTIPEPNDIRIMPQVVDYGRAYCDQLSAKKVNITIWVPELVPDEVHDFKSTSHLSQLNVTLESNSIEIINGARMRVAKYVVSWREPPADGPFAGEIEFTILGGEVNGTVLSIPVRGDSVDVPLNKKGRGVKAPPTIR
ncbi:MAG: DUF1573 domain-containing protein [Planctomycetes bacterium]|nr:DUF1573 domain-containing protein [Planctomycetota bacterium]